MMMHPTPHPTRTPYHTIPYHTGTSRYQATPNAIATRVSTSTPAISCDGHKQHYEEYYFSAMLPPPPLPPFKRGSSANEPSRPVPPPPPPPPKRKPAPPPTPYMASSSASAPVPKSYEPYGEISSAAASSTAHRRHVASSAPSQSAGTFSYGVGSASSGTATATSASYSAMPPSSYGKPNPARQQQRMSLASTAADSEQLQYAHNSAALAFLLPSLLSILWWHESPVILQTLLILGLILYGLDMVNARDALAVVAWISALAMTMVSGFATLLQVDDSEATGGAMVLYLVRLAVEGLFFCTLACWFNLQFSWLHREVPSVAKSMEKSLHSMLPPISSSILSYHIARLLMDYWGMDRVATFLPHLFAMLMAAGMLSLGCTQSSFVPHAQEDNFQTASFSSISLLGARGHSMLLLIAPGTIHLLMFRQRILSRHAASDELYDLILVWSIPYILHCGILVLQTYKNPYEMSNKLFPNVKENTLRGTLLPMIVSLLASLAAQQRYVIPVCNKVSYQFNGHDLPSTWIVSMYLTMATFSTLLAVWTWGRKSLATGELLFGEYHEDVVQLSVSASGLLLGKAFGFPWNLTPLPILAFLGLSVWVTTRMLRYLSIFLFVVHAGSVVLFSYRFASIDIKIPLAIPGLEVSLIRFGTIEVVSSVLIALVAGFAVRPPGGVGAAFLKRVDVPGMIVIAYELLLVTLEITLLKRPAPQELVGQESDVGVEDAGYLYDHASALLTSVAVVAVALFTQRLKIISPKACIVALSLAIAKAISVVIDANESDGKIRTEAKQEHLAQRLFYRTMMGSFLLIVMMAPRAILSPIHLKTTARHKRSLADGKPIGSIPSTAVRNVVVYTMVILPASLLSAVPMVLTPLVMALSSHYGGGAYYKVAPPLSEMAGFALTLWGIASLSMMNYYLPDGGAETWKKASALTLLMGIGVTFSAPTVPDWIVGDSGLGVSNPYASISSLGTTLATQGRNRTGGWGILSASLATLLAITGPLELRERRPPSGRKDQYLLLRLMLFSLLFGSGVSWFITIQSMGQEKFFELLMTGLACMVVSFFGTVTCVLGYFLELENLEEVESTAKIWVGAFCLFGLVTGMPALFASSTTMHAFGAGGWLSTYLAVSSLAAFSLTMALRLRSTTNQATRGLANASCVLSYVFAVVVLYGRYGVSGMDETFTVTTIVGIPASVLGTFLVAPMLLALEGEMGSERRSRVSRISAGGSRPPTSTIGLTLPNLTASNRFAPAVAASFSVLFLAGLYAIFLRGSFLFASSVATSHHDLFSKVTGKGSDSLAQLAQRSVSHSLSLVVSARMAGSGFWTASSPLGPLIHLGGLVATVPSTFLLLSQMWSGLKVPKSQVIAALPVNLIPLLFCRGIPAIPAAALVGSVGGVLQILNLHRSDRRSQMRI